MNEDLIITKLLSLEEQVEKMKEDMATKADIRELMGGQDKMIRILERVDHERMATNVRMDRFDDTLKQFDHRIAALGTA